MDLSDPIILVPYDPQWPSLAEKEIKILRETLKNIPIVDIQHAGSTSIPQASAKPIIDLYIGVENVEECKDQIIPRITKLDYIFWEDNPDKTHLLFIKGLPPYGKQRSHHIHVIKYGDAYWNQHMFFRDYLIQHPKTLQEYCALKDKLAIEFKHEREAYTQAKTEFIMDILKKATV